MSSTGYQGRGSKLQTSPDGVSYTTIAQLQKYSFGGLKVATDDITNLDSPTAFKEIIATIVDPGDVSFDGIANPVDTTQQNLLTLAQNRTLEYFKILLTNGSFYTFQGYVTEYVPANVDYSKAITFSGKITITGAVTFSAS